MNDTNSAFPTFFDWNIQKHSEIPHISAVPRPTLAQLENIEFDDEGPRDGLQGTSVFPGARDIQKYIDLVSEVGIPALTVGIYSGDGSRAEQVTFSSLKYMAKYYPEMTPIVVVRPLPPDLAYAKECIALNQKTEVLIFQGSSAPRLWVQGWTEKQVLTNLANAIDEITALPGGGALSTLEDATRATPEFLREFLEMSVRHKAKRVVFADTSGHVDMWGAYRFVRYCRETLNSLGKAGQAISIDFHGHRDRNLDVPVALAAISAGATRIHGVVLGIGERSGNCVLDSLMYNVTRMVEEQGGEHRYNLTKLPELCRHYATITSTHIPRHYPLIGDNAFMTAVGIHADAQEKGIMKLQELENIEDKISDEEQEYVEKMLRTIYTSVDHKMLGRIQRYVIGPLSGEATVRMWLYSQGYDMRELSTHPVVTRIKNYAKQQNRTLRDEEVMEILEKHKIKRTQQVQL